MQGQKMKKFLLLPLVLVTLEVDQSRSASLPERLSSSTSLSSRTNQISTPDEATADQVKVNDLTYDESRRRHLYPGTDETFEHFLRSHPSEDDGVESVAERTARGYFSEPRDTRDGNTPPTERGPSSVRNPLPHDSAVIEEREAQPDITSFALPEDARKPKARDSKLARSGDGGANYNNDRSATYNSDSGAVYNQGVFASQRRDDGRDSGFMGDDMHQSLMAKIHEASAHAFDGVEQPSRLEFGPSPVGSGPKETASSPSYKPVYEAPSRQPDPRPHPGQRPAPLTPDDESDYRANDLDDSPRDGERYRDGRVYQDYDGLEAGRDEDYRQHGGYQGKVEGGGNYQGGDYRKEANEDDYRGNAYQDGGYGGGGHRGGDYEGGDYRGGDYEGEDGRRGGYAAFDPYKEAAQEEEAFRAVEGETDRYGEYSRSQGGARHPDREQGTPDREQGTPDREEATPYPSRYEESAMNRGNTQNGDEYNRYHGERRRQSGEGLEDERSGYRGNRNNKRSGHRGDVDFGHVDYYDNQENGQSRYYGNSDNGRGVHRSKRHVYDGKHDTTHSLERQKRDLGGPGNVIVVTEEVRSIHPVIHRHYEGIPVPAKAVSPLSKELPAALVKIPKISAEIPQATVGINPAIPIFREDIPPSSFVARLALPSRDGRLPGIVEKAQKTVFVGPLSSAHALTAPQKPGQGQTVVGGVETDVYPADGAQQKLSFAPGVIHTGFVPMIPLHRISKRSSSSRVTDHVISDGFSAGTGSPEAKNTGPNGSSATPREDSANQSKTETSEVENSVASTTLSRKSVDRLTSGDSVTSGDLQPAGSRRRAAYQPHYAGYGRQQGRQNAEKERDPYERYLPREEDNDPYFRYAPREDIQHSHELEQAGRTGVNTHQQYDLYGQPRQNSHLRRPQVTDDYEDYGDEDYQGNTRQDGGYPSYDDYEEDYSSPPPRNPTRKRQPDYDYEEFDNQRDSDFHSNNRRGNRRGKGQRYQEVDAIEEYDDDFLDDYQDNQRQGYQAENPRKEENKRSTAPLKPVLPGVAQNVQKFTPGVIQNGFVPITRSPHQVRKRSLAQIISYKHTSDSFEDAKQNTISDEQQDISKTSEDLASRSSDNKLPNVSAVTSDDPVTSGDLQPAGSRRRTVYQPHYAGYGRQQGRQNAEKERDPYERYLPREEDNDPYFRYAPRENIQHSHHQEQSARTGERNHDQHDLYGRPRKNSHQRRPQTEEDYANYEDQDYHDDKRQDSDYPSYEDYEDDHTNTPARRPTRKHHPEYDYDDKRDSSYQGNGLRGNRRTSGKRYQDYERNQDYDDDLKDYEEERSEDYEDAPEVYEDNQRREYQDRNHQRGGQKRRYQKRPNSAYHSGRYSDDADERQDKDTVKDARSKYRQQPRRYRSDRPRSRNNVYEEDSSNRRRAYEDPYDESKPYEAEERYPDSFREAPGAYEDNPREAAGGYEDTRKAVSGMLEEMAQKKRDGSCKEVKRDGMSCLQCSDINGVQTEECAYAGEAPGSGRSGYSSSSSYGVPPERQDGGRSV